jgi:SAM-dependent methyltransferase
MRNYITITIDYETWHPIPPGKCINWEEDIFAPTERFLEIAAQEKVKLTFMAEMGEYFWLKEHEPLIAQRMEQQWQEAVAAGHDVQLHLHPNWLPELEPRYEKGRWQWNWSRAKAGDYPGNLIRLIKRCKDALESIIAPADSGYRVTSFRAGAYQVQPFKRLYEALAMNNIFCDSSVYQGGYSIERGYDFRLAYSRHQPYFANAYDPQLKAPPSETAIVELPVFTYKPGQRWFLDGEEGPRLAAALMRFQEERQQALERSKNFRLWDLRRLLSRVYWRINPVHRWFNLLLPAGVGDFVTTYTPESLVEHDYFLMIGHTKGDHHFRAIAQNWRQLHQTGQFEFLTLSQMAGCARDELNARRRTDAKEEMAFQIRREYQAIMGEQRNRAQSYYLQNLIPLDRQKVLDLGCGTGYWADRIARMHPWMEVTGIDCGVDFIAKASAKYIGPRVSFRLADFQALPFADESFDCVYADNSLEHAFDVDATLKEAFRILRWGGVLVAAIPSDGRNPERIVTSHTWKTVPHEIRWRLECAGFVNLELREVDTLRKWGMPPYPPSQNKMVYVRAWKQTKALSPQERVSEVMNWVYRQLSPERPQDCAAPRDIITRGYAWCGGYSQALRYILEREGYRTRIVSFYMQPHPRGHGKDKIDTHTLLEVKLNDKWSLVDPTCNLFFNGYNLRELVQSPRLADEVFQNHRLDDRFVTRRYDLYCSRWAFEHCIKVEYCKDRWKEVLGLAKLKSIFRQLTQR